MGETKSKGRAAELEAIYEAVAELDNRLEVLCSQVQSNSFRVIGKSGTCQVLLVWRPCSGKGRGPDGCWRCNRGRGHGPYWVLSVTKNGGGGRYSIYLGKKLTRTLLESRGMRRSWVRLRDLEYERRKIAGVRDALAECVAAIRRHERGINSSITKAHRIINELRGSSK